MDSCFGQYHQQHQHQQQQQQQFQSQQQQQHQQQTMSQSSYSQASSPQQMHSMFQSSASHSSLPSISTSPSQTSMHSRQSPILSSAPLPSPTAERQSPTGSYFGSFSGPSMQQSSFSAQPFQQQMNSIPQQSHYQHGAQQQQLFGQDQRSGSAGGLAETAPYLQGFNLLAEAAKRAEMAVLMRDLEDFEM